MSHEHKPKPHVPEDPTPSSPDPIAEPLDDQGEDEGGGPAIPPDPPN